MDHSSLVLWMLLSKDENEIERNGRSGTVPCTGSRKRKGEKEKGVKKRAGGERRIPKKGRRRT